MKPGIRARRSLRFVVILLVLIGVFVVVRRTTRLVPILINGYHPPAATSSPMAAQLLALDDIFARYPTLTLIVRAHLLQTLGEVREASSAFGRAIGLAEDQAVRNFLLQKRG